MTDTSRDANHGLLNAAVIVLTAEKLLQTQGFGSRKQCRHWISHGDLTVQGETIRDPSTPLQLHDHVSTFQFQAKTHTYHRQLYLALNKPLGYECSHQTSHHSSVFELFPASFIGRGLQCVGRLDQDTSGLLLLTDDGSFLHALTHPRKHVSKCYQLVCADPIAADVLTQLANGVTLRQDGVVQASNIVQLDDHSLQLSITQGLYHQVRRMMAATGHRVVSLERIAIAGLQLDQLTLPSGHWRPLSPTEIALSRTAL